MYKYETHLHTSPVSKCAKASVRENLEFYKELGYAGVFITNHFANNSKTIDQSLPYEERMAYYFSDYENGVEIGRNLGLQVFCGIEITFEGTDFLIYGLDKEWYLKHPEIEKMRASELLPFFMEHGALVIQAHPYREAGYIDHIRLFPRCVHGVEVINSCRTLFENQMAKNYADSYELIEFAGSDNHVGRKLKYLAGMCSDHPLVNEADFVEKVKNSQMNVFEEKIL